ncbi:MAG: hypothetical protein CMJ20_01655 [Phycisphaeraceae bacterium]|nr:hypothetical protein [Phycisphaeraceae bacterium]|tara:strand:+ start:313 stop:1701 length:1389 start_codon:yes stop_codon:yes gene_type:complete
MNKEQIKQDFENLLKQSDWWQRFIGSQFVAYIALFVAQIIERVAQASERTLQESFLTLATRRSSILAGAEGAGYVGRKIAPSSGTAILKNTGPFRETLPALTQALGPNQLRYTIMDSVELQANETREYLVKQLEISKMRHVVTDEKNWLSILFPNDITEQIHNVVIRVNGELWKHSFKFRNCGPETKAYMEYYKASDQLGVRFGNNITGKAPKEGDVIEVELWLTVGDSTLLNDQPLELIDSEGFDGQKIPIEVKTKTAIVGGAGGEDIESIRNSALYSTVYDDQLSWDADYSTFITNNVAGIVWMSVWGEKAQEKLTGKADLKNINTIFISAYSDIKTDDALKAEILEIFKGREGYNENYIFSPRRDHKYTVEVTGSVLNGINPTDVEKAISAMLAKRFGRSAKQSEQVYKNTIWKSIESESIPLGIEQFEVKCIGLVNEIPVDTYQFLDLENSTIRFNYN